MHLTYVLAPMMASLALGVVAAPLPRDGHLMGRQSLVADALAQCKEAASTATSKKRQDIDAALRDCQDIVTARLSAEKRQDDVAAIEALAELAGARESALLAASTKAADIAAMRAAAEPNQSIRAKRQIAVNVAELLERQRRGDILTAEELAILDIINQEFLPGEGAPVLFPSRARRQETSEEVQPLEQATLAELLAVQAALLRNTPETQAALAGQLLKRQAALEALEQERQAALAEPEQAALQNAVSQTFQAAEESASSQFSKRQTDPNIDEILRLSLAAQKQEAEMAQKLANSKLDKEAAEAIRKILPKRQSDVAQQSASDQPQAGQAVNQGGEQGISSDASAEVSSQGSPLEAIQSIEEVISGQF